MVAPCFSQPSISALTGTCSMEDSTDPATSSRNRSARQREMLPPEEAGSRASSRESPKAGVAPTHPVPGHHRQISAAADLGMMSPALDKAEAKADVEMTDTRRAPVTTPSMTATTTMRPAIARTASTLAAQSESSRPQAPATSTKTRCSTSIPVSLPFAQSMPATPTTSRLTLPAKTGAGPGTAPFGRPDQRHTVTYSAHTTPDTTSSTEHEVPVVNERPKSPFRSNLHKRRASASPDKFSRTRIDPLEISSGLEDQLSTHPPQRGRTRDKIEVYLEPLQSPYLEDRFPTSSPQRGRTKDKIEVYDYPSGATAQLNTSSQAESTVNNTKPRTSVPSDTNHSSGVGITHQQPPAKRPIPRRKKPFSLLEAFVRNNDLLVTLTSYLHVPSIISLYAISKSFHLSFNRHATAFILSNMRTWAPNADNIFPWRCYLSLCIKDPIKRLKSVPKAFQAEIYRMGDISRDVPSLRWLQMVVWREAIVADMIMQLSSKGLRCPTGAPDAIKRMWFALDLPLNAHRLALFRSVEYFPDHAIICATHFFLKCDMAFTDPGFDSFPPNVPGQPQIPNHWQYGGLVGCTLREKLAAERNFTSLWRVIKGWSPHVHVYDPPQPIEESDIAILNCKHKFRWPPGTPIHTLKGRLFNMKYTDMMFTGCERTYQPDDDQDMRLSRPLRPLLPLHHLLQGEGIRRKLRLPDKYIDMIVEGFIIPGRGSCRAMPVEQHRAILRRPPGSRWPVKVKLVAKLKGMREMLKGMRKKAVQASRDGN